MKNNLYDIFTNNHNKRLLASFAYKHRRESYGILIREDDVHTKWLVELTPSSHSCTYSYTVYVHQLSWFWNQSIRSIETVRIVVFVFCSHAVRSHFVILTSSQQRFNKRPFGLIVTANQSNYFYNSFRISVRPCSSVNRLSIALAKIWNQIGS